MSDPVSNAEIEDVLTSIRRLISESKASDGREESAKTEKLVLTPAFRVHDEAASKRTDATPDRRLVLEQPAGPMASDVADDSGAGEKRDLPVFSHRGYAAAQVEDAEEVPDQTQPTRHNATSLTGRAADFEDEVNQRQDGWEPDGGDETAQTDVLMFHAARLRSEDEDLIIGSGDAETWSSDDEVDEAPFVALTEPAEPAPTPPVSIVQRRPEQVTPQAPSRDIEIVGEDTDIIDEEVVQAMVARLVREELQGEVGEKITQVIRRFVRREIERALTLKGLE